jgi:hypothetical protein
MMATSNLVARARLIVAAGVLALPLVAAGAAEVHNQGVVAFTSGVWAMTNGERSRQ